MLPVVPHDHDNPFSRSNKPRNVYPPFCRWTCTLAQHLFWLSGFPYLEIPKVLVDVRYDLSYASVCPSHPCRLIFKFIRAPKLAYPLVCLRSYVIAHHLCWLLKFPISKMQKFLVDVRQNLHYTAGWLSHPCLPFLKVKKALKIADSMFCWW